MTTLEMLKEQLAATEYEFEDARALAYRCEGAVMVLKGLIARAETEAQKVNDGD